MPERQLSKLEQKIAQRRVEREEAARRLQTKQAEVKYDEDLIPDSGKDLSDADKEMDKALDRLDILDAYRRWCGKMNPDPKGRTESIMISCPIPGHTDSVPSAWINTDKQTWFCGGCQLGGDAHDIAAYHFGFDVPGYKIGSTFHELRKQMAQDLGYTFTRLPGNLTVITAPEEEVEALKPAQPKVASPEPTTEPEAPTDAQVVELFDDDEDNDIAYPSLDWKSFIPTGTYLDSYMKATCIDDVPEEYHFWNALLGLGFAMGRDVRLFDFVPVYGNLFVCTLGRSGSGKSKARSHLTKLLNEALPHDWADPNSKGVRTVSSPGSGESLIHNFQKPVEDPSNPKKIAYYAAVRGMVDFNELSVLVGKANRAGNVTVPVMMQFYDMEPIVATSSMTHGSKEAHQPFASALTTTQPRALKGLITKADDASGFLNRWVFAPGKEKVRFAIGGIQVDMHPVAKPLTEIQGWAASFGTSELVTWSPEAATRFTEFFHSQIEPDKKKSATDLIIRIDLLMKKLILLFSANRMHKEVQLISVEDAIACYDYLIASYKIPEEQIGNSIHNEMADAVIGAMERAHEKGKPGLTLREIARSLARHKYSNDGLLKTIDALVKLGFVEIRTTPKGSIGRPTVRYAHVG